MPKYVVRYGSMRILRPFGCSEKHSYRRGQAVIVRTDRGLETGDVLCEAMGSPYPRVRLVAHRLRQSYRWFMLTSRSTVSLCGLSWMEVAVLSYVVIEYMDRYPRRRQVLRSILTGLDAAIESGTRETKLRV